nr:hypothetical protein [Angustibacter aerolatus]
MGARQRRRAAPARGGAAHEGRAPQPRRHRSRGRAAQPPHRRGRVASSGDRDRRAAAHPGRTSAGAARGGAAGRAHRAVDGAGGARRPRPGRLPGGRAHRRVRRLVFQHPDAPWQGDLDLEAVREQAPPEQWPRQRTYTVRRWDPVTRGDGRPRGARRRRPRGSVGRPGPARRRACTCWARAAATPPTPLPTGCCWPATRARCRRSRRPPRRCRPACTHGCWSRWPARTTRSR